MGRLKPGDKVTAAPLSRPGVELAGTIAELDPAEVWITHGREDALMRWCELTQRSARPLHLVGYEDEAE